MSQNNIVIEAKNLAKDFVVIKKRSGLRGAVKDLFFSQKSIKKAVDDVSFAIQEGEIVGYLGPNGAGKSTTIKMLCGILNPTRGSISIRGRSPYTDRQSVVKDLGVVFGQRSQLYWDLRLGESFELLKRMYQVEEAQYKTTMGELNEILDINEIIDTPVRQLSLRQRMRGDLAASMLHSPSILFLDEPTIGLDIDVKYAIRKFIKNINERYKKTIILTTHDLDDVQALCHRVIIINHGKVVSDSPLDELIKVTAPYRQLIVDFDFEIDPNDTFNLIHDKAEVIKREGQRVILRFEKDKISASELIGDIAKFHPIRDVSLEEANIDDVIRHIYHQKE